MANHGFELLRREPALVRQRPVRRGGPPALEGHPRARVPRKGARKPLPSRWRRRSLVGGHASGLFPGAIDGVEGIPNAKPLPSRSRCFQESLIAEAQSEGLSISPDNVLGIAKSADGKIIWIETGTTGVRGSGLAHIIEEHGKQFSKKGIDGSALPDYLLRAVTTGAIVGMQGTRPIYEFAYNGIRQRVAITVSRNGYIVGDDPKSLPKEKKNEDN